MQLCADLPASMRKALMQSQVASCDLCSTSQSCATQASGGCSKMAFRAWDGLT